MFSRCRAWTDKDTKQTSLHVICPFYPLIPLFPSCLHLSKPPSFLQFIPWISYSESCAIWKCSPLAFHIVSHPLRQWSSQSVRYWGSPGTVARRRLPGLPHLPSCLCAPSCVKRWTFDGLRAPVVGLGAARQGVSQAPPPTIVSLPSFVHVENFLWHNLTV